MLELVLVPVLALEPELVLALAQELVLALEAALVLAQGPEQEERSNELYHRIHSLAPCGHSFRRFEYLLQQH